VIGQVLAALTPSSGRMSNEWHTWLECMGQNMLLPTLVVPKASSITPAMSDTSLEVDETWKTFLGITLAKESHRSVTR
jgi:hypothetical protein